MSKVWFICPLRLFHQNRNDNRFSFKLCLLVVYLKGTNLIYEIKKRGIREIMV